MIYWIQYRNDLRQVKRHSKIKRAFTKEMSKGNTKAAIRLLSKINWGSTLHPNDIVTSTDKEKLTVLDVLKSKHPASSPPSEDAILPAAHDPPTIHPVIFDSITAKTIRSAALRTTGAAVLMPEDGGDCAPLSSQPLTIFATPLHSSLDVFVGSLLIPKPYMSCRLDNKNPSVRPIGIGEVVRRIIFSQLWVKTYRMLLVHYNYVLAINLPDTEAVLLV